MGHMSMVDTHPINKYIGLNKKRINEKDFFDSNLRFLKFQLLRSGLSIIYRIPGSSDQAKIQIELALLLTCLNFSSSVSVKNERNWHMC